MSFFVGSAARRAAPPFGISMLGAAEPPLRRGFAWGKTLVRRTRAAGQKAGGVILLQRSCQSQISILPVPSTKKVLFGIVPNSTFFFGLYGGGKTAPYPPWGAPPADPNALAALASSALRSSIASFRTSSFTFISRMVLERSFSSSFMEI